MKTKTVFVSISVFLYLFLPLPPALAGTFPLIILSEIQIAGEKTDDEFIELYNSSATDISLKNYKIVRRTKTGISNSSIRSSFTDANILPARGYYLLVNKDAAEDIYSLKDNEFISSATLTPDNSLAILDKDSAVIDAVAWGSGHVASLSAEIPEANPGEKKSLVRDLETRTWSISAAPTPTNSRGETYPPPVYIDTAGLRINELLPNPEGDDNPGEFIELYNENNEDIDLEGFFFEDSSGDQYKFPKGDGIKSKALFVIARPTLTLTLVNSNQTISLSDSDGKLISSVTYEKTKEGVSLNYTAAGWRGGTPTPGATNILNNLPETKEKVPKKGYHGVAIDFDAQGKDSDHDSLKYTWDFGDGHKSYKEKTSHAYEENGTYAVTLKTTDGKDDTLEIFTLKIQDLPHPEIRITSLLPNPAGSDTDNEWIMIENREKKTVNLKDFSIATGWKTLANHPINEDFLIQPKTEAKLTRAFSLFTLPNQKGKIELRAPDGKVLQEIKYKLEKSIAEDVVYQKKKGQKWTFGENVAKNILPLDTSGERNETRETLPEKNALDETVPEENVNNETSIENTAEVLGVSDEKPQLSLDPDRPQPQDLLAYGTHARLPDTITLTPAVLEEIALLPGAKHTSFSLAERLASHINASLNRLLNSAQEE